MKKFLTILKQGCAFIFTFVLFLVICLFITFYLFCHGPSASAEKLFVSTFLETGQMKFVVRLFLSGDEIQKVVATNSLKTMSSNVDSSIIDTTTTTNKNDIKIEEISGDTFSGTMMTINDPSRVFVATTGTTVGTTLDDLVTKSNGIGGVNGGLFHSAPGKGGGPIGPVVTRGVITHNGAGEFGGLTMVGFDENNILQIKCIDGMNENDVENYIKTSKIRDAVTFQEEASGKTSLFVKLIVNGVPRKINGDGSGANPRTVIGQKKDGTVLLFVTDGRGINGNLGATASDLIRIMQEYGAVNAANVDGGSSSSMYYNGKYLKTSVTFRYSNASWIIPDAFIVGRPSNE